MTFGIFAYFFFFGSFFILMTLFGDFRSFLDSIFLVIFDVGHFWLFFGTLLKDVSYKGHYIIISRDLKHVL